MDKAPGPCVTGPTGPPGPDGDPFAREEAAAAEQVMPPEFLERARALVALKKESESIDRRLAEIKIEKARLDTYFQEVFAEHKDLQNFRLGGRTIFMRRQLWASAPDKAAAYDALIAAGLPEYAQRSFNSNSVSALFREWERNGETPPPELEGIFRTGERYTIGVTKE